MIHGGEPGASGLGLGGPAPEAPADRRRTARLPGLRRRRSIGARGKRPIQDGERRLLLAVSMQARRRRRFMITTDIPPVATLPRLGADAPAFEAVTTHGTLKLERLPRKLAHPLLSPGRLHAGVHHRVHRLRRDRPGDCAKRNVELLGLSIDSVYSHIAWVRNIEQKLGVRDPVPGDRRSRQEGGDRLRHDHAGREQDGNSRAACSSSTRTGSCAR